MGRDPTVISPKTPLLGLSASGFKAEGFTLFGTFSGVFKGHCFPTNGCSSEAEKRVFLSAVRFSSALFPLYKSKRKVGSHSRRCAALVFFPLSSLKPKIAIQGNRGGKIGSYRAFPKGLHSGRFLPPSPTRPSPSPTIPPARIGFM